MEKVSIDNEAGYEIVASTGNGEVMRFRWNFELDDIWSVSTQEPGGKWGKPEPVSDKSPQYEAFLQYFGMQSLRNIINFGKITRSSPKQLRKLKNELSQ